MFWAGGSRTGVDIPVDQLVGPASTCLLWPNASGSPVRSGSRDRVIVDTPVEGEVRVRVKNKPVRIGEVTGPVLNTRETVPDGNIETLSDAGYPSEHVVSLDVAAERVNMLLAVMINEFGCEERITHKEVRESFPITLWSGSFITPRIPTRLEYSGWEKNSPKIRI